MCFYSKCYHCFASDVGNIQPAEKFIGIHEKFAHSFFTIAYLRVFYSIMGWFTCKSVSQWFHSENVKYIFNGQNFSNVQGSLFFVSKKLVFLLFVCSEVQKLFKSHFHLFAILFYVRIKWPKQIKYFSFSHQNRRIEPSFERSHNKQFMALEFYSQRIVFFLF